MSKAYGGHSLGLALAAEGLLPKECVNVELHMPVDGVVRLRYEVNVITEDLPKLARAIASLDPVCYACQKAKSQHGNESHTFIE